MQPPWQMLPNVNTNVTKTTAFPAYVVNGRNSIATCALRRTLAFTMSMISLRGLFKIMRRTFNFGLGSESGSTLGMMPWSNLNWISSASDSRDLTYAVDNWRLHDTTVDASEVLGTIDNNFLPPGNSKLFTQLVLPLVRIESIVQKRMDGIMINFMLI